MTTTIWKYELPVTADPQWADVELPEGAVILTVGARGDQIVFWAFVEPGSPMETRRLGAFPTGWDLPNELEWHGSCVAHGNVVVHVVEVGFDGEEQEDAEPFT